VSAMAPVEVAPCRTKLITFELAGSTPMMGAAAMPTMLEVPAMSPNDGAVASRRELKGRISAACLAPFGLKSIH
jgi:hypothetical protein